MEFICLNESFFLKSEFFFDESENFMTFRFKKFFDKLIRNHELSTTKKTN